MFPVSGGIVLAQRRLHLKERARFVINTFLCVIEVVRINLHTDTVPSHFGSCKRGGAGTEKWVAEEPRETLPLVPGKSPGMLQTPADCFGTFPFPAAGPC